MDPPKVGSAWPDFPAFQKWSWRWPGLAMRAVLSSCRVPFWLFSLAPTIWSVEQPDPWQSCRLFQPMADPQLTLPKCIRAKSEVITRAFKHDQKTRANKSEQELSNTIKKRSPQNGADQRATTHSQKGAFFTTLAQSQSHQIARPSPTIRMFAGQCSSSRAASSMAGCPLGVHTCTIRRTMSCRSFSHAPCQFWPTSIAPRSIHWSTTVDHMQHVFSRAP